MIGCPTTFLAPPRSRPKKYPAPPCSRGPITFPRPHQVPAAPPHARPHDVPAATAYKWLILLNLANIVFLIADMNNNIYLYIYKYIIIYTRSQESSIQSGTLQHVLPILLARYGVSS